MTTSILILALAESIAIYGLVSFIVTWSTDTFYVLLALSLVSFAVFSHAIRKITDKIAITDILNNIDFVFISQLFYFY